MLKTKTKPRRVKGVASRHGESVLRRTSGRWKRWKWIWITLVVLLLIAAMEVARIKARMEDRGLRMVAANRGAPAAIEARMENGGLSRNAGEGAAGLSMIAASGAKTPLRYRWVRRRRLSVQD